MYILCAIRDRNAQFGQKVAVACLFLASKGEEAPRKLRDILNVSRRVLSPTDSPLIRIDKVPWPVMLPSFSSFISSLIVVLVGT